MGDYQVLAAWRQACTYLPPTLMPIHYTGGVWGVGELPGLTKILSPEPWKQKNSLKMFSQFCIIFYKKIC